MSKPKHAPRPWIWDNDNTEKTGMFGYGGIIDKDQNLITWVYNKNSGNLIAAAPDMLEALRTAHAKLLILNALQTAHEIEKIIKKAEGQDNE